MSTRSLHDFRLKTSQAVQSNRRKVINLYSALASLTVRGGTVLVKLPYDNVPEQLTYVLSPCLRRDSS